MNLLDRIEGLVGGARRPAPRTAPVIARDRIDRLVRHLVGLTDEGSARFDLTDISGHISSSGLYVGAFADIWLDVEDVATVIRLLAGEANE